MLPKSIPIPVPGGLNLPLPKFLKVTQFLETGSIPDVAARISADFTEFSHFDLRGKSVAIAVGSRGIKRQLQVIKAVISALKNVGALPFIFPAMGSHGGGTAEGQTAVLSNYGYTESALGVPVRASMEVIEIGRLDNGTPVYCDIFAHAADWIIPVNRVKPHTSFRAKHESGIAKMLAIGTAKHAGAEAMHFHGAHQFESMIPEAAQIYLEKTNILFGIGIVENAVEDILQIELVPPAKLLERDAALLELAKATLPKLMFNQIDVLIIDKIGKNISGAGLDPNVTGRPSSGLPGFDNELRIDRIIIRDLTDNTEGNACGLGTSDVTTQRLIQKVDWTKTYVNMITAGLLNGARLPIVANTDREAISIALRGCPGVDSKSARIVRIASTLELTKIWVSSPMINDVLAHPKLQQIGTLFDLTFNKSDQLMGNVM